MYQEGGGAPCNESPLGAAFAIQSWLLSSWNFGAPEEALKTDALRVFSAVPSAWPTASIGSMSAEGGYNVSALYENNQTAWIHLTATAGGSTRNVTLFTDMAPPLVTGALPVGAAVPQFLRKDGAQNVYSLSLQPGDAVLLQPNGATAASSVKVKAVSWPPLQPSGDADNYWGKHKRANIAPQPPPPPPPQWPAKGTCTAPVAGWSLAEEAGARTVGAPCKTNPVGKCVPTVAACEALCTGHCSGYTWHDKTTGSYFEACYLATEKDPWHGGVSIGKGHLSGICNNGQPPPPSVPPPGPAPADECGSSAGTVAGYTCFSRRCAYDGPSPPHRQECGGDICHPAGGKPPTDPAAAALCALVSTGPNSTAIAAARCNAFKGCTTFARCLEYSPSHCEASSTTDVMADGGGVCYKYFTSGKDGLADNIDWVAWVKAH
jgi:hypothetical protein